ncbi:Mor transcription activator family protein [Aggregatibacter actinomycetemcomitans]|uniref:Mor transcription activator family protein n=1 Tax=Aggregatibacter actinomycetemcomitans TaxID=714 RepID=UPI001E5B284A|nr:Mor transcription activator family protein [Aggregatibacter actinomycetemcomitans]
MRTQMELTRHELLQDIEDQVSALCKNYNLDMDICEQIAVHVADFLTEHYAGMVISFPKDFHYKIAQRDLDIYNEFTGNNWLYLIRKYNMTESGIRKVINRVRKRIMKHQQPDLFCE